MLLDHDNLEEFADGRDYDLRDASDTGIAFYDRLAQEAGDPILEIACGTGRVSIPIAQRGFDVTGLDIAPDMLAQARRKSAGLSTRWVEADARNFDLGARFRLIFLTGNAFQAFLTRADQEALLARVQAHLHQDGLFAFETRNPRWTGMPVREKPGEGLFINLETCAQEQVFETYLNLDGQEVQVSRTQIFDHLRQIVYLTTYHRWFANDQAQSKITRIALRFTFPLELEALLHYNGFAIIRQYGDWNLEPLAASSPSIISVCRKRAA